MEEQLVASKNLARTAFVSLIKAIHNSCLVKTLCCHRRQSLVEKHDNIYYKNIQLPIIKFPGLVNSYYKEKLYKNFYPSSISLSILVSPRSGTKRKK